MKLFNTILVWDVCVIAESEEAARAAVYAMITATEDPLKPSDSTAIEAREERNIRTAWRDERPIVGADVSDDDFETLKGKTVVEAHAMLYKKPEPTK